MTDGGEIVLKRHGILLIPHPVNGRGRGGGRGRRDRKRKKNEKIQIFASADVPSSFLFYPKLCGDVAMFSTYLSNRQSASLNASNATSYEQRQSKRGPFLGSKKQNKFMR